MPSDTPQKNAVSPIEYLYHDLGQADFDNLKAIMETQYKVWQHHAQFVYSNQITIAKNYIWLAITVFTGLAAIYAEYGHFSGLPAIRQCIVWSLWSLSLVCGAATMLLATICLSTLWFKSQPLDPFTEGLNLATRFESYGTDSKEYFADLLLVCGFNDDAIAACRELTRARGLRLRKAAMSAIAALLLSGITFFICILWS